MPKKLFRVAELGVGNAQKIFALARNARHANVHFSGVDLLWEKDWPGQLPVEAGHALGNLQVERGKPAGKFLSEHPPETFDHIYAHFLLGNISHAGRQFLFRQIMRTLKPGARFYAIENVQVNRQFKQELSESGFLVSSKPVTPGELLGLGSQYAAINATMAARTLSDVASLPQDDATALLLRVPTRREQIAMSLRDGRTEATKLFEKIEGKNPSLQARKALKNTLEDLRLVYSKPPFVLIRARKPR